MNPKLIKDFYLVANKKYYRMKTHQGNRYEENKFYMLNPA
jgi:hypothetical protein